IVRPRTQRADAKVRALAQRLLVFVRARLFHAVLFHRVPDRLVGARLLNIVSDFVDEALERMRTADIQPPFTGAVGVQIDDGLLLELIGMSLNPFGRTQQSLLFAVPRAQDDRAFRLPALLEQLAQSATGLHERDLAARGI